MGSDDIQGGHITMSNGTCGAQGESHKLGHKEISMRARCRREISNKYPTKVSTNLHTHTYIYAWVTLFYILSPTVHRVDSFVGPTWGTTNHGVVRRLKYHAVMYPCVKFKVHHILLPLDP